MGTSKADMKVFMNVSIIVAGVVIASIGEIKFVLIGVLFQIGGILFEATRLVMVERLLSSAEYKMDPLVSLYYFAPVCALMNLCVALVVEIPKISMAEIQFVGPWILLANAMIAFGLNVSVVFLVCPSLRNLLQAHLIAYTDRPNIGPRHDPLWCPERHTPCCSFHRHLGHSYLSSSILRLQYRPVRPRLLQAGSRNPQN